MSRVILIALAVVVIAGVAYAVSRPAPVPLTNPESSIPNAPPSTPVATAPTLERVAYPELGFSFSYPQGDTGYLLSDIVSANEQSENYADGFLLTRAKDALGASEAMEGPPSISVRVFSNPQNIEALPWAEQNTLESNLNLALGDVSETVLGGANGIRYRADGLYATETTLLMYGKYVYVITGGFIDENDQILKDYETILQSMEFVPEV